MNKINKNVEILKFSGIAKVIEKANALGNDVIRLEVGDVDLDCPKEIREGIDKAFEDKKTHYPPLICSGYLVYPTTLLLLRGVALL